MPPPPQRQQLLRSLKWHSLRCGFLFNLLFAALMPAALLIDGSRELSLSDLLYFQGVAALSTLTMSAGIYFFLRLDLLQWLDRQDRELASPPPPR